VKNYFASDFLHSFLWFITEPKQTQLDSFLSALLVLLMSYLVNLFFYKKISFVDYKSRYVQMGSARWAGTNTARLNTAQERHGTVCPVPVPGTARPQC
jgi:hypothetical protein